VSRTYPFARSFNLLFQSRFGSTVYGRIQEILDTVLPVQVVGTDYSDVERPCWGIATSRAGIANRYSTSTITSAVDIAIEGVGLELFDPNYAVQGLNRGGPFYFLTPPSTWIPWANTPGAGPTTWYAGIRPRVEFDPGRTIVITGCQSTAPPFWGAEIYGGISSWVTDPFLFAQAFPQQNWHHWDPPLILPATMFLTACSGFVESDIWVSWRYREIG
jgi:hypothetical protein